MARLLFAASEVYPFAKTGGLADVAFSLPRALGRDHDVTVVMPLYRSIDRKAYGIARKYDTHIVMGTKRYTVTLYGCRFAGTEYLFVYAPLLCNRDYLYGSPDAGYEDNALRFGLFSHAVVHLAKHMRSDVVHLNDWQSALAALLIAEDTTLGAKTVFTIHNLAYQGVFDASYAPRIGIDEDRFTPEGVEYYGKLNLMKAGIGYADTVTTVSPTYAQEILTPEFGCGLEGYLRKHRARLTGIINGIDTEYFSPESDSALYRTYKTPREKAQNKKRYLEWAGMHGSAKPLFIFIGRFTWQKGMDLLIDALTEMAVLPCTIAILGEGESHYRDALERTARGRENVHLYFGYDEALAHRMYAAADFLLMPSLFEPCGLNQLIAMHYGAVPVVHRVGGLADTVKPLAECGPDNGCGIVFESAAHAALMRSFKAAIALYDDTAVFRRIGEKNMRLDVSWKQSAGKYEQLYLKISERAVK